MQRTSAKDEKLEVASNGVNATIYSLGGKEVGKIALPESVFGLPWNGDLVHQVATSLASSERHNIAHAKTRGEVRGGGKKPWRQKGTGRARHGSTRSPIWVGGGVTHGPRNDKNYERIVPKKMRAKALFTILSRKFREGEILFVDSLSLGESKTREAVKALETLSGVPGFAGMLSKKRNSATIALASKNKEVERSFKNLGNVEVIEARNMNPLGLLEYKYLVIENPDKAFEVLPGKSLKAKEAKKVESKSKALKEPKAKSKKLEAKS